MAQNSKVKMYEDVLKIKEEHKVELLAYRGVIGVGIGYKSIKGEETEQLSITVSVERKIPLNELEQDDIIPGEVKGIPTDVVEVGEIRAQKA